MTRFGIEEEFQLLDEDTLIPVPLGTAARAALPRGAGTISKEFLTSQLEFSTSPVSTLADARAELIAVRRALGAFGREYRIVPTGSGTPFGTGPSGSVLESPRYGEVARWLGHIVDGHHVNGLHVHVEVEDEGARIRALNGVRPWMPVLLALSGNSPYSDECDTGHQSWRSIVLRRLPLSGCPPHFRDMADYRATVERFVAQRVIPDIASVSWLARLSADYPTVELRIFDAQLTCEDSLLFAAISRALVQSAADFDAPVQEADSLQAALWVAAREGLDATLVHPASGELIAARDAVELLLQLITPALDSYGDLDFVHANLARILRLGTGADRQRAAYAEGGVSALRALHLRESEHELNDAADQK